MKRAFTSVLAVLTLCITQAFAQDSYTVEITASKGKFTVSNQNKEWHSRWESNEVAGFSLSTSANNMKAVNDNIAGYSGQSGTSTYTVQAPEGYVVKSMSFDYVNTDTGTHTLNLAIQGKNYTSTQTKQSLDITVSSPERTFTFTQSGANKGITFSNFVVSLAKDTRASEKAYEVFKTEKTTDIPYRIPAIAMAKNGDLVAVADYRHSGKDIGMATNGRIDIRARISKDNGNSWNDIFDIIQGRGANGTSTPGQMYVAFGDPCIVTDRESGKILVLTCSGNVSYPNGTRNNHQGIAHFYSNDNGVTWTEPVDRSESIYSQFDNSNHGPVRAMFVGSGKIHQSRYVKVGNYYRIYCAVLLKNKNSVETNFVLYSDDFGENWKILGGVDTAPIPNGANEPKVEELPNGNIIVSSRCNGGRHYNIFTFTDAEKAEGSWGSYATSNASVNGVIAQGNSCNGEIMIVPVMRKEDNTKMWLALQSLPFGNGRNNVGIYYKELESEADFNTPANFAKDWDGRHQASNLPSAYSTMCYQKDSTIAFLYEEDTYGVNAQGGYNILYKNYSIEQITNDRYTILKGEEPVLPGVPEVKPIIPVLPDMTAQYRLKAMSRNQYLHIEGYNANNETGPKGSVGLAGYTESDDQIFKFVDAGNDKVYLCSASGYYIVCRPWNIDACNTGEKTAFGMEYCSDTEFYLTNTNGYVKVGEVDGQPGVYYPYCDAAMNIAER